MISGKQHGSVTLKPNVHILTLTALVHRRSQRTSAPKGPGAREDPRERSEGFTPLAEDYKTKYECVLQQLIDEQQQSKALEQKFAEEKIALAFELIQEQELVAQLRLQQDIMEVATQLEILKREKDSTAVEQKYTQLLCEYDKLGKPNITVFKLTDILKILPL